MGETHDGEAGISHEAALPCQCLEDWLRPECDSYRGMRVWRAPTWYEIQHHVDEMGNRQAFGPNEALQEEVHIRQNEDSQRFKSTLSQKACRLAAKLWKAGLPRDMCALIQKDFTEVAATVAKVVPSARSLILKLDLVGANTCSKWHQDNYTARAVITYNLNGTEYVDHQYVDFEEMRTCDKELHIIRDTSKICTADVGDILFMKGKSFPGQRSGLVHKSPKTIRHTSGLVKHRLMLKVDVP